VVDRISVKCREITPKEDHLLLMKPVRESYLGEGVNTPNLATIKDFIKFYVVMSRGKIKQQRTADLVNNLRRVVLC
jgi:hypothetical protein